MEATAAALPFHHSDEGDEMNEQDLELLRLQIMKEVNERFDELIAELNENGSEFSRALKKEVERLERETHNQIEEVYSYMKSKLVSIEAGHKMLYDPADGLLTKILKKAEATVKMATDAAACTVEARKAADDAKLYIRTNIFVTAITFLGILITVVTFAVSYSSKSRAEDTRQQELITAMRDKIKQDATNQEQTVAILKDLKIELKKAGQ